jgi:RNA polymerase sigma-70 factor (ECF subfamily)
MWSASDDALLDGLATGDPDAAAAFIERFQRRVFGLAVRIVGDARLAEDVAQETFVRAWRRAGAFDARRGTVAAWLLTITRNLAIDAIRVRRSITLDPEALLAVGQVDGGPRPEDAALLALDASRLRAAIAVLPPEQRRALAWAAFGGRTAREVAELEDIPLGTAKTRIRSAMLRLRAALVDEEPAE